MPRMVMDGRMSGFQDLDHGPIAEGEQATGRVPFRDEPLFQGLMGLIVEERAAAASGQMRRASSTALMLINKFTPSLSQPFR